LSLSRLPLSFAAVIVAGTCGPLLTGGLSSRLPALTSTGDRRAQGWDGLTYGVGGTAGPALVAGLAVLAGPLPALLVLSAAAALAGLLVLTLPAAVAGEPGPASRIRSSVRLLVSHGPLRRVTTLTLVTALGLGALPVIATIFGAELTGEPTSGAGLTAAFGLGSLLGALLMTVFPLTAEADKATIRNVAAVAVTAAAVAAAPFYAVAVVGFALIGVANALFFTATLAARATYAPPEARAQVFVTSAGLKIAMASAGAAAAGLLGGWSGRTLLVVVGTVTLCGAVVGLADRLAATARGRRYRAAHAPCTDATAPRSAANRPSAHSG
jgi:hypothetical protein